MWSGLGKPFNMLCTFTVKTMKCSDYEPGHGNSTCWIEDNLVGVGCSTIYFSMQCCRFYWNSKIRNMCDKITCIFVDYILYIANHSRWKSFVVFADWSVTAILSVFNNYFVEALNIVCKYSKVWINIWLCTN